jgi:PAS domain S-box-containing protein
MLRPAWMQYAAGVAAPFLATVMTWMLWPWLQPYSFALYFGAVAFAAWFGGIRSNVLTVVLSALLAGYFFIGSPETFAIGLEGAIKIVIFVVVSASIILLGQARSRAEAAAARRSLEGSSAEADAKIAQEDLAESEAKFRAVADTAATAIYIHDGKQFVYVNHAAEEITGFPKGELLKKDLWELVHPDDRQMVKRRAIARMRDEDAPARYEYRIVDREGNAHWIDFAGTKMMFGRKPAILATALDITERKLAEEIQRRVLDELIVSEQRLSLAHRAAGMGSWEWDIATNELAWSPEIYEMHGIPRDGSPPSFERWFQSIHPEDSAAVKDAIEKSLATKTEFEVEFRVFRPDGEVAWVAGRGKAFYDVEGRPARMAGIGMDITQRKNADAALRLTEKLAATGRLAATIAHEINNPLESVTNLLYLLEHEQNLSPEAREYLQIAGQELGRVVHITRQTLAFYRDTTRAAPVHLAQLLDEIVEVYSRKMQAAEVTVRRDYREVEPVMGMAGELRQVFSNLLTNALDALPRGGEITLRVRRVCGGVRVSVVDNGHGIQALDRKRIFEPFFTTKGQRGTGLGLWVSCGIVQKHLGRIQLRTRTQPGRSGTIFSIVLPHAAETNAGRVQNFRHTTSSGAA